ncbi:IS3 family transposase [Senegalimassilia anaerobia]|uniref:IS3 family transposase n=1 Tax=Senegalimassilia anaerobia TaxID=1473216 RepID=UPI00345EC06F
MAQSMSRPGNPWDDALAESFFKTLKRELANGKDCKTREEAKRDVFKYIEPCYNRQRMHSRSAITPRAT